MTPEELMAQHPGTYKAILDKGIAQGSAEGREAGRKAGFDEGRTEGAKTERERIQGIESLSTADSAKIVAANKFNPEMTKEKMAVVILEEQKKKFEAFAAADQKDGEDLAKQAANIGNTSTVTGMSKADQELAAALEEAKAMQARK